MYEFTSKWAPFSVIEIFIVFFFLICPPNTEKFFFELFWNKTTLKCHSKPENWSEFEWNCFDDSLEFFVIVVVLIKR